MNFQTLSAGQNFYSDYFPELLQMDPNQEEFTVGNPFNNYKNNLIIDQNGMFTGRNPANSGFITDFYKLAEGMDEDQVMEYFQQIRDGNKPPSLDEISIWSAELFKPENKKVLDYLTIGRGLSHDTINNYKIGFKSDTQQIVFPVFNLTGHGLTAAKFTPYPPPSNGPNNKVEITGGGRLLGYHELTFQPNGKNTKYIVDNEFDALFLRQLGCDAFCGVTKHGEFIGGWEDLFKGKDVVVLLPYEKQTLLDMLLLAENAKTCKRVDLKTKYVSDYFVNGGHTIEDFNGIISESPVLDAAYFMSSRTLQQIDDD